MKFCRIQKNIFFNWASDAHAGGIKTFFYFWDFEHAGNPLNEQLNWYGLM
jgi:hypothetical protein